MQDEGRVRGYDDVKVRDANNKYKIHPHIRALSHKHTFGNRCEQTAD